ncbi:hypothetical protein OHA25_21870 [Nonomuraea sp. NBC_00507]|uniref:hypothetical protein n=1 Tax=Nonomuraea sp. NBC_00507 TaxID=2976002 RepID=UPI002E17661A
MNVTWVSLLSGSNLRTLRRAVCHWSANARQVRAVYWRPPVWSSTPLVVEDHSSSGGFQRPTPPAILNRYLDLGEAIVTKTRGFRLAKPWRKAILMIHILASVGWFGLATAISVLEIAALGISEPATLQAAYRFHELLVGTVVVPSALTTVLTGVVICWGTPWGMFKYYWPPAKLVVTVATIAVTVVNSPDWISFAIANADAPGPGLVEVQQSLVGLAALHIVALVVAAWLSLYKPFGKIKPTERVRYATGEYHR